MIELILGGARSGKSRLAESRIAEYSHNSGVPVVYIATATDDDDEMKQRIARHKSRRPEHWIIVEEPIYLASVLAEYNRPNMLILIDCLTLWLSNLLCHSDPHLFSEQKQAMLTILQEHKASIFLVSNETGLGVVPMGELTRRFVDEAGWLHQELASISDRVTLVIAGLEHSLKSPEVSL